MSCRSGISLCRLWVATDCDSAGLEIEGAQLWQAERKGQQGPGILVPSASWALISATGREATMRRRDIRGKSRGYDGEGCVSQVPGRNGGKRRLVRLSIRAARMQVQAASTDGARPGLSDPCPR